MTHRKWSQSELHVKLLNAEQRRRIEEHKWIESEKMGYDIGETAIIGWVEEYAHSFRDWAESLPYRCVNCGCCIYDPDREECVIPFDTKRLKFISDNGLQPLSDD